MKKSGATVEPHYTLKEAVERFFPGGRISVRSLRTEIRKGRLRVTEVAGKFLVSESAIAEMLESCKLCPGASATTAQQSGTSATERIASARAAAQLMFDARKKPLHNT